MNYENIEVNDFKVYKKLFKVVIFPHFSLEQQVIALNCFLCPAKRTTATFNRDSFSKLPVRV